MVIAIDAHKIAYMALPKAGCSSVKEALARLDPDVAVPKDDAIGAYTFHDAYPTRRFRPHRWQAVSDHWRFCVIRDPAKRLMSCYTNRVLQFGDLRNSRRLRKLQSGSAALEREPGPDAFFRNLEAYKTVSSSIKHHAMGAWLFLGPELRPHYDRIYKTDELDVLARDLSRRCARPVRLRRRNSSEVTLRIEALEGATIDALRPFLDQEYAYFEGFYTNPLGKRLRPSCAIPIRRVS
ncbi:sulfotransferase family protein [Thalassococcus sp. CAU 1522]|uniref:Sulfotransferase family protein n=1 Tax=Thalassococcus arenae TaxID=2851652 RepID=A0ABS6NBT6_9RHOB|nr:sulfotransferase family 2 domain-containing protein [Thalassococcus arenae]MBV2361029.1 sulfotransferase family protein [Thalassococcus arenae]